METNCYPHAVRCSRHYKTFQISEIMKKGGRIGSEQKDHVSGGFILLIDSQESIISRQARKKDSSNK